MGLGRRATHQQAMPRDLDGKGLRRRQVSPAPDVQGHSRAVAVTFRWPKAIEMRLRCPAHAIAALCRKSEIRLIDLAPTTRYCAARGAFADICPLTLKEKTHGDTRSRDRRVNVEHRIADAAL